MDNNSSKDKTTEPFPSKSLEELIAFRVAKQALTWVGAVIGSLVAVVGFFGYKQSEDLLKKANEAKQELGTSVQKYSDQMKEQQESLNALAKQLRDQLDGATQTSRQAETAVAKAYTSTETLQNRAVELGNRLSEISGRIAARMDLADKQQGEGQKTLDSLRSRGDDIAADVNKFKNDIREGQGRFQQQQQEEIRKLREEFAAIRQVTGNLSERVFGGTAQLIREKSTASLAVTPDEPQQPFTVSAGVFHEDSLEGFTVRDREQAVLVPARNLRAGEVVRFSTDKYQYTLTNQYILELTFEKDAAGIDIRWTRRTPNGKP